MSADPWPFVNDPGNSLEDRLRVLFEHTGRLAGVGPTKERPRNPPHGAMYIDTDLNKPVWFINGRWRDATGAVV